MGKEKLSKSDFISVAALARSYAEHYGKFDVALEVVAIWVAENIREGLYLDDDGGPHRYTEDTTNTFAQLLYDEMRRRDATGGKNPATRLDQLETVGIEISDAEERFDIPYVVLVENARRKTAAPQVGKNLTSGEHASDQLALLNQAAAKFWSNADRNQPDTQPKKAAVTKWLEDRGFSRSAADKGASIIRPKWAHAGKRPEPE